MNSPRKKRSFDRVIIKCLNCNINFPVANNRKYTAKYCSRSCGALHVRQNITAKCLICNKLFTHISSRAKKAKYCGRQCYYKAQHLKGTVEYKCHHCDKKFLGSPSKKRKFCSKECVGKESKTTWNASFITVRKNMLNRGMIKLCNRCGFDSHVNILGVHHIDRNRRNNELSNLEILCPNCHSIEHSKHINHTGFFE